MVSGAPWSKGVFAGAALWCRTPLLPATFLAGCQRWWPATSPGSRSCRTCDFIEAILCDRRPRDGWDGWPLGMRPVWCAAIWWPIGALWRIPGEVLGLVLWKRWTRKPSGGYSVAPSSPIVWSCLWGSSQVDPWETPHQRRRWKGHTCWHAIADPDFERQHCGGAAREVEWAFPHVLLLACCLEETNGDDGTVHREKGEWFRPPQGSIGRDPSFCQHPMPSTPFVFWFGCKGTAIDPVVGGKRVWLWEGEACSSHPVSHHVAQAGFQAWLPGSRPEPAYDYPVQVSIQRISEDQTGLCSGRLWWNGWWSGEEAFYEDEDGGEDESPDAALITYSDDEELEAFLGELTNESLEDPLVADAFATVAQHKMQKKGNFKKKGSGHGQSSASFPFKAQGDISFDKAKDQRKSAVKFLKSVTECTSCHQRGHWVGDPECPNTKKGKGKGGLGKKKPFQLTAKKKASSNFFVLDDAIESEDEAAFQFLATPQNVKVPKNFVASVNDKTLDYDEVRKSNAVADTKDVVAEPFATENDAKKTADEVYERDFGEGAAANYAAGLDGDFTATLADEDVKMTNVKTHSVLMVLKDTGLCEHSSYNGGSEKRFHRGANGHTRHVTCKDPACDKSILVARRKEPLQLWRYLVLVAMCTNWGSAARSRALAQSVAVCSLKAREEEEFEEKTVGRGYPRLSQGKAPSTSSPSKSEAWDLVEAHDEPQAPKKGKAKIIYEPEHQAWLYGVHLRQDRELPPFPELDDDDLKILQPLPSDQETFPRGPLFGLSFVEAASKIEYDWYCRASLTHALENQPMTPDVFRFAFYLYGRVKLVHSAGMRMLKGDVGSVAKRSADPTQMSSTRSILVPLQLSEDPRNLQVQQCDVMMTSPDEAYVLSESDPPGLALLDTGCSRTMHGADWASRFEAELKERGLLVKKKSKIQVFRGVGGETRSEVVKAFPVSIGGVPGEIFSAETPGSVPLLMSRPFMEKLGTVLDLRNGTVSFEEIGIKSLPLLKTSKGHLAVNMLDFPIDKEVPQHDALATSSTTTPKPGPLNSSCEFPGVEPYTPPKSSTPSSRASSVYPPPSDAYVDSDNPDIHDRWDRQAEADWLRMEVEGYEQERRRLRELGLPDEGWLCEDVTIFEAMVQQQEFPVRKTTQRKGKKLDNMSMVLDSNEIFNIRKLQGRNHEKVTRKPAAGKTWLKQLFAGQMGLSLLAVLYGMSIGVPLDSSSSEWDATSNRGHKWLHNDLQSEDPYVTVITHPCGPWGNWSRFNLAKGGQAAATVVENREATKPLLRLVNKTVKDRVKAKRHVFIEQPLGSESLQEPEMADVLEMVNDGRLIFIKVDGCMVGYKDKENGKPHKKPSYYITSMVAAESVFQNFFCDGSHEHQPLEGNNKFGSRTCQAAEWPQQLNKLVLEAIIQQSAVEKTSLQAVEESYPAEVRPLPEQGSGSNKRQRKRGRVAIISAEAQAPPVYLRPEAADEPELLPQEDEPPVDDAGFRAAKAAALEPTLNMSEGEIWMAEDWPWDKEDHQGFACELWPSHSIYPAEDFEATECQEWRNSCCRSHGLWCLWRIVEEKKAKAGEIAKPVRVQQAHSGGHHVCQGQPWHYVFFSQHRGWCHGFSGGVLPWRTTRTSCITCGCQTLYKFLELLGRFATLDAGGPWKRIPCQLRWLSQDLRSWARSYASWSTLERRKVWESRRPLERPMEEDCPGGKCFWAWRRSFGYLHRHSGSQFFPSFQWLCTNPMGT